MQRSYSQIPPSPQFFLSVMGLGSSDLFMYMYPTHNIEATLATTIVPHTYNGSQIVSPTMVDLLNIAYLIWENTSLELPPAGYNVKIGCLLRDLGKSLSFQLPDGSIVATWRLMELITDQIGTPGAGQAPPGTIGYVPVFVAGVSAEFDRVCVARVG